MSKAIGAVAGSGKSDPVRNFLRFGLAAAGAAFGARSVSQALTRAWISSKAVDSAAGTLNRTIK